MTEDDARTKWCPFARCDLVAVERLPSSPGRCIASACMAWRTETPLVGDTRNDSGYCGLAGRVS